MIGSALALMMLFQNGLNPFISLLAGLSNQFHISGMGNSTFITSGILRGSLCLLHVSFPLLCQRFLPQQYIQILSKITTPGTWQIFIANNFSHLQLNTEEVLQAPIGIDALYQFGIAEWQVVF